MFVISYKHGFSCHSVIKFLIFIIVPFIHNSCHRFWWLHVKMIILMVLCQKGGCNKIKFFKRAVQSLLNGLQCVIITSLWSYLKLQNSTEHEMHTVFDGTIHFPKFSFIWISRFIRPFGIGIYALWCSTTYESVHPVTMV